MKQPIFLLAISRFNWKQLKIVLYSVFLVKSKAQNQNDI